ncbi:type II toxin-antitoxin system RelE/ParE family toxin [Burkholderia seminalis]|uniref:type II toxin-antitoxin system RelE/ParE family toxin n=1 Tax=Burkholderia seminalis TaxID=488731 RepID=UPI001CF2D3E2|nr:type II toxin-antitoxin system RelE/ParE family toxin [Burkholderia seminalis]MCA7948976.1 type II toxin-antitoxin system RelE/ParE family toxin [Burkholderia seminalis]
MVDILPSTPYCAPTFSIRTTDVFDTRFACRQDRVAKRRIHARIDRLSMGNPGDWKSAGSPVVQMRIDPGPGYRVYSVRRGPIRVILRCGGDQSTQQADIRAAHAMLARLDME